MARAPAAEVLFRDAKWALCVGGVSACDLLQIIISFSPSLQYCVFLPPPPI